MTQNKGFRISCIGIIFVWLCLWVGTGSAFAAQITGTLYEERVLKARHLVCDPSAVAFLRKLCLELGGALRACQPSDILNILVSISEYEGKEPQIDPKCLTRAAMLYFAKPKDVAHLD